MKKTLLLIPFMLFFCAMGLFAQTGYASIGLSSGGLGDGRIIENPYGEDIASSITFGGGGINLQAGFFLGQHFALGGALNAIYVTSIMTNIDGEEETYYYDDIDGTISFYNLALLAQYVSDVDRRVFVKLGIGPSVSTLLASESDDMLYAGLTGIADLNVNLTDLLYLNLGASLTWDAWAYDLEESEQPEGYTLGLELYLYVGIGFKF